MEINKEKTKPFLFSAVTSLNGSVQVEISKEQKTQFCILVNAREAKKGNKKTEVFFFHTTLFFLCLNGVLQQN